MTFSTPGYVDPVILPADVEWMAQYYLTPIMSPTPVATRLPQPAQDADTVNGFLRVEFGGGTQANKFEWNLSTILHAYSPNEIQASQISRTATAWMAAARGQIIAGWGITEVPNSVAPHRLADPNVQNLTRYRSMVTWRVPGQILGS